jgi:hypothetical protein
MDLLKDGKLIKFDTLHYSLFNVSVEFMENYIYESEQKKIILQNIKDLYVFVIPFNKLWKNILDDDAYKILKKYNNYIIGFILLDESAKTDKIQYIDYIDSRLKKHNIAQYMIKIYEKENNIILIPYDILKSASKYWKNYFEKKYNIFNLDDLDLFIKKLQIKNNIYWDYLIQLY